MHVDLYKLEVYLFESETITASSSVIHAYGSIHVMLPKNKLNIFISPHVLSVCLFKKVSFVTSDIFVYSDTISESMVLIATMFLAECLYFHLSVHNSLLLTFISGL